jgi:uncharacterized protein (TIGR00304 family)
VLDLVSLGLLVIFGGVAILLMATLLSVRGKGSPVRGAGVVLIGPIPVVLGTDAKWASVALVLAMALVVLGLLLHLV